MHRSAPLAAAAALALAITACSTETPSTVSGSVDTASFGEAVSGIVAIDALGQETSAALGADGAFSLPLASGTSYRLVLEVGGERVPVAARLRSSGYGSVFAMGTDGAALDLGELRYLAFDEARGLTVDTELPETCVDGVSSVTGQPCIGDEATVDCSAAEGGMGDGDGHHGRGRGGRHHGPHDGGGDAEADDGIDVVDLPVFGDGVAVPEAALPLVVACGMIGC